ncbi:hypothetical protein [Saccharobesus litoralis]|nr:hypothetical protein [Saccharobesus litoralis]
MKKLTLKTTLIAASLSLTVLSNAHAAEQEASWWDKTKAFFSETFNSADEATKDERAQISEKSKEVYKNIKDEGGELLEAGKEKSKQAWEKSKEKSKEAWSDLKENSKPVIDDASKKAKDVGNDLLDGASNLFEKSKKAVEESTK